MRCEVVFSSSAIHFLILKSQSWHNGSWFNIIEQSVIYFSHKCNAPELILFCVCLHVCMWHRLHVSKIMIRNNEKNNRKNQINSIIWLTCSIAKTPRWTSSVEIRTTNVISAIDRLIRMELILLAIIMYLKFTLKYISMLNRIFHNINQTKEKTEPIQVTLEHLISLRTKCVFFLASRACVSVFFHWNSISWRCGEQRQNNKAKRDCKTKKIHKSAIQLLWIWLIFALTQVWRWQWMRACMFQTNWFEVCKHLFL